MAGIHKLSQGGLGQGQPIFPQLLIQIISQSYYNWNLRNSKHLLRFVGEILAQNMSKSVFCLLILDLS